MHAHVSASDTGLLLKDLVSVMKSPILGSYISSYDVQRNKVFSKRLLQLLENEMQISKRESIGEGHFGSLTFFFLMLPSTYSM